MGKGEIGGLEALVDGADSTEHVYDWKRCVSTMTIDDPAVIEAIKAKIAKAEEAMVCDLQEAMFPPLTPEKEAAYALLAIERGRPINRLRAWGNKWRWRLSDAWDVLRGKEPSDYDD